MASVQSGKFSRPTQESFNEGLLEFLKKSPTPFHAVHEMVKILHENGYQELREEVNWDLKENQGYFVRRNDSSLVAFWMGERGALEKGIRMVGAHTDSPCLKVKPKPDLNNFSYAQLGVEIYGGVLLSTWFDRDLSLAGKVTFLNARGELKKALIDFKDPLAVIPNLAIHLNREANENRSINKQKEMPPILFQVQALQGQAAQGIGENPGFFQNLLLRYLQENCGVTPGAKILGFDLSFYDVQVPQIVGFKQEFITSARLDNLLSCYVGLRSLIEEEGEKTCVLICNDHEEVGSASYIGAQGPFLRSIIQRICGELELEKVMVPSLLVSTDNAHGIHPNFMDKHDPQHAPLLNLGPVLKINANQRYSTDSETGGLLHFLSHKADVPLQSFVARSDMGCGSTIGPITSTVLGVKTVDVGVPTFAMHSIREMAGVKDGFYLYKILRELFVQEQLFFEKIGK